MLTSLWHALWPLLNALGIVALVWALYAVAAVQLYGDMSDRSQLGLFGSFTSALGTLFQVASGDSWVNGVVRLVHKELITSEDPSDRALASSVWPFFVSYYFVSSIVLFNIIVAILLDEFINATAADKFDRRATTMSTDMALDWVLTVLSGFSTPRELHRSIQTLFKLFDNEDENFISFINLRDGLERIRPSQEGTHKLTREDWETITENGRLCDARGHLDLSGFEVMLRRQLCIFSLRRAATSVKDSEPGMQSALTLLKVILLIVEAQQEEFEDEQLEKLGPGALKKEPSIRLHDDDSNQISSTHDHAHTFSKRKGQSQNNSLDFVPSPSIRVAADPQRSASLFLKGNQGGGGGGGKGGKEEDVGAGAKGEGGDGGRSEGKEGMDGLHLNFLCMVSDVDVDGMEMGGGEKNVMESGGGYYTDSDVEEKMNGIEWGGGREGGEREGKDCGYVAREATRKQFIKRGGGEYVQRTSSGRGEGGGGGGREFYGRQSSFSQRNVWVGLKKDVKTSRELSELLEREAGRDRLLAELVERDRERDRRDAATNERLQQVFARIDRMSVSCEA